MAPSLDGVSHVTVVADPVAHAWMARGKLVPSLLPGLGSPGPWAVGAIVRGVITVSSCRWGACVRAVPVDGGHRLGWLGRSNAALGGRRLNLLLDGKTKELTCLELIGEDLNDLFWSEIHPLPSMRSDLPLYIEVGWIHGGLGELSLWSTCVRV
jgi:hypothetical protein